MFNRFLAPLAAVAILAATPVIAPPAFAQPAPEAQPGDRAHNPLRERLQQLHERLGITPAQQPQWEAMVAAMRENAQAMRANPAGKAVRGGGLNAVQEIRAAADLAHARADALQHMVPSVEALYAGLSPEQQRTADQVLAQALHAGRGRG